jgi:hypothetical protein
MASNSTSIATLKSAHTAAEVGGVSGLAGVNSPIGNSTAWSRAEARKQYSAGTINQTQFNGVMTALQNYESTQYQAARDAEGSSGMIPA